MLLRAHSCDANASRHLPHLSPIIDSARGGVAAVVVVAVVVAESRASRIAYWKSATERKAYMQSTHMSTGGCNTPQPSAALSQRVTTTPLTTQKLVLLPGMGCTPVRSANFYGWLERAIETDERWKRKFSLTLRDFPDPTSAESIWIPFVARPD